MQGRMWQKICGGFVLLAILAFPGWAENSNLVAVAASMAPAMESILTHQKECGGPGNSLEMVNGASGKLARQIEENAPFGLFLSANEKWVRYLEEKGLLEDAAPLVESPLVLWWSKEEAPSLDVLRDPKSRIAVADPEVAPIGAAGKKYLENLNLWEPLFDTEQIVITGDILKSVLAVKHGGATVCFVTEGTAIETGGSYLILDAEAARYFGGVVTKFSSPEFRDFWNFLRSPEASSLWNNSGFHQIP